MRYIIVSGFTDNPIYEERAFNLASSLNSFNLSYEINRMEERGSWNKNCQQKAEVILETMLKYRKPVVWLDADAVVCQKPDLFDYLVNDIVDVAYHALPENRHLASGTLYFAYTQNAIRILNKWIETCKVSDQTDQKILQDILWDNNLRPKSCYDIMELPIEYCKIFDNKVQDKYMKHPAVILHTQASRELKGIAPKVNLKGKTILICGNGGSLPEHLNSVKQDDFDFVCRINNYKTSEKVGFRTDIWSTSFWYDITPAQILSNRNKVIFDTMMFGKVYNYRPEWRQEVYKLLGRGPNKIMSQDEFKKLCYESKLTSPSTGISTIHLALILGMKPTICGFNFFSPEVQHHYYSGADTKKCPHKGEIERAYIEGLEKKGVIHVIK